MNDAGGLRCTRYGSHANSNLAAVGRRRGDSFEGNSFSLEQAEKEVENGQRRSWPSAIRLASCVIKLSSILLTTYSTPITTEVQVALEERISPDGRGPVVGLRRCARQLHRGGVPQLLPALRLPLHVEGMRSRQRTSALDDLRLADIAPSILQRYPACGTVRVRREDVSAAVVIVIAGGASLSPGGDVEWKGTCMWSIAGNDGTASVS